MTFKVKIHRPLARCEAVKVFFRLPSCVATTRKHDDDDGVEVEPRPKAIIFERPETFEVRRRIGWLGVVVVVFLACCWFVVLVSFVVALVVHFLFEEQLINSLNKNPFRCYLNLLFSPFWDLLLPLELNLSTVLMTACAHLPPMTLL